MIEMIYRVAGTNIEFDNQVVKEEHSFFNQLPFLETVVPNAIICPLLIGNMNLDKENGKKNYAIIDILLKLLKK